jgi:hypothetical protein
VYALRDSRLPPSSAFDVSSILAKFPSVSHFQCSFLGRSDDVTSWYT